MHAKRIANTLGKLVVADGPFTINQHNVGLHEQNDQTIWF